MNRVRRLSAVAIAFAMVVAFAMPALAANSITVGKFVQELARAKNLNATDAIIATDSLAAVGVNLPKDLDLGANLTEGTVAAISRSMGLNVTTSRPDRDFNTDQVNRFLQSFTVELGAGTQTTHSTGENPGEGSGPGNGNSGPPFDPFSKGKGKNKGKGKGGMTPTEPE
ncbi:MAG: hypothetical protein OES25_11735 [Acidobacteriota bacterium]|nr:hypothetical protein [Acidobacteriota bacterium]